MCEHSDTETAPMDDTTLWDSDAVPSSPPTSIDEESVATKHDVSLAEDTETEIEPKKRRLQEPEPPKTPKKRGRPKKTADATATTPKTPGKRGRKPKAAAAEGEDDEPTAKKRRGRPAKAKTEAPATPASAEPSTPTNPAPPAAPVTPAKSSTAPATPAKTGRPAGTSTAMTHVECEYIYNSMMDAINWGNVVKEANKKAGKDRQAGNVKTHWNGFVRKAVMGLYKA